MGSRNLAILTELNSDRHDVLWERSDDARRTASTNLSGVWNIYDRSELVAAIDDLMAGDATRAQVGWNYPRVVTLARSVYGADNLTEAEAWNLIFPAAQRIQQSFSSWLALGEAHIAARAQFYNYHPDEVRHGEWAFRSLAIDPELPWRKYPWNLDLGAGHPVAPGNELATWIEVAAHPQGVICVRLGVPHHKHDDAYLAAIENTVGCKPRITNESANGPDWIVNTECTRPGTIVGAQVIADFQLEEIAKRLRRDGVTLLFTYFEHIPHNQSSILPAAHDSMVEDGWRWYIDYRSLRHPLPEIVMTYGVPPAAVRRFLAGAAGFLILSLLGAFFARGKVAFVARFSADLLGVLSAAVHQPSRAGGGQLLDRKRRHRRQHGGAYLVRHIRAIAPHPY